MTAEPVGAAWIRLFSAHDHGYGYIDDGISELSIALLPEYRSRRIGTNLLKRLIEDMQEQYSALSLSVSSDDPAARLYQRLGFEIIGSSGTSLTMKKALGKGVNGNAP